MVRRFSWLVVVGLIASAVPVGAAEGDKYLPSGTQLVVTLNVKQMLDSSLVKKDLDKIQQALKGAGEAQQVMTALGFDPLKDLDSIVVAAVGADDQEKVMLLARGKFDTAKFKAKAEEVAKNMGDVLKIHKVGDNTLYEANVPNQPKPMFACLVDGQTIVASPQKDSVTDALDIKAGKKKAMVKKELQALLDKTSSGQSLSVAVLGDALGGNVPFGDKVEHIKGGITLGDEIQTEFVIVTKDADSAKAISELLKMGLDQGKNFVSLFAMQQKELAPLAEMIDVLKVTDKDATVTLKGTVTKEALEKLKK